MNFTGLRSHKMTKEALDFVTDRFILERTSFCFGRNEQANSRILREILFFPSEHALTKLHPTSEREVMNVLQFFDEFCVFVNDNKFSEGLSWNILRLTVLNLNDRDLIDREYNDPCGMDLQEFINKTIRRLLHSQRIQFCPW